MRQRRRQAGHPSDTGWAPVPGLSVFRTEEGLKELIWNCKEFPSEGGEEAMWSSDRVYPGQNAAFFLRNAEHSGESGPLSCSRPKHCLCVSSVLGPPSWMCRSATDLMLSP